MATADRHGRMAQWLNDQHACLSMTMHEALLDAERALDQALREAGIAPHGEPEADR